MSKLVVDKNLVKRVAVNSRIILSDDELIKFVEDFKEILNIFSKLEKFDVDNVEPSFRPVKVVNIFRDDVVTPSLPVNVALKNSAHKKDNYFLGPKVI